MNRGNDALTAFAAGVVFIIAIFIGLVFLASLF